MTKKNPFGRADCESELKILKSDYRKIYFDETPFNGIAIEPETYLIVGRRGSGKTALSQYFSFQEIIKNKIFIDIDEPAIYNKVLIEIAKHTSPIRDIAIRELKILWETLLWSIIFEHTHQHSNCIADVCGSSQKTKSPSDFIRRKIESFLNFFIESPNEQYDSHFMQLSNSKEWEKAKEEVLKLAAEKQIIISIDTLEKYGTDSNLMNAMAALIECAADFNLVYSSRGIHIKTFISGEIFPFLKEEVLLNPSKCIREPVYLLWRPRDLLRLISWRYYHYLVENDLLLEESRGHINWENSSEVMQKMWVPYFGLELKNRERTFSYILRHTQMRPRQLILMCNKIANKALQEKCFPRFSEENIRSAVDEIENELATEIINSFSSLYPNVSSIVDALMKMPMEFKGSELDKRAKETASEWPPGEYSPARFRRLVAELGIIGRVTRRNDSVGYIYIDADFEYSLTDRLPITHRDECVIHPMFEKRLKVEFDKVRVLPFSTDRDIS